MFHKIKGMGNNRIITLASISSIVVGILIIVIGMTYYRYRISELGITDTTDYKEYDFHYAIISEESDEPFWEAIYQGALEQGRGQNVYIEKIGRNLSIKYTLQDLMKIAIASRVDGIILEPNGDESIIPLIDAAVKANIPVITVIKDVQLSKRISFVGINSYNQGQAYGKQVLDLVKEGKGKITVLLSADNSDNYQSVIYSSIVEAVNIKNAEVKSIIVNTQSPFRVQEDIRNIMMENPPDILVCLSAVNTLYAYQAVVDYNRVGEIHIIGYYDADIILQAIHKNIVHSTMTIDASQMGAYCVEALLEYEETGRVSDFYSVDIQVINNENVEEYMEQ